MFSALKQFAAAIVVSSGSAIVGLIVLAVAGWKVALIAFALGLVLAVVLVVSAIRRSFSAARQFVKESNDRDLLRTPDRDTGSPVANNGPTGPDPYAW